MSENRKQRKHFSPEQKVLILRELLENNLPISQIAAKYQIHPNDIYSWKKKLFEGAKYLFQSKTGNQKSSSIEQRKIEKLESKLRERDEAITMLLKENIEIKKSIDGEI